MGKPKRKPARASKRITTAAAGKRNTPVLVDAGKRNTQPAVRPMRATAQLDAFPSSANAVARQSHWKKAVVSVRLKGDLINRLDARVEKENKERSNWNQLSRSAVILRAVEAYLSGGAS